MATVLWYQSTVKSLEANGFLLGSGNISIQRSELALYADFDKIKVESVLDSLILGF
jgi:hypothetical protein